MRLFQAFDVDEETPVQFLGIYTTRWRPEWGKPQIMFREVEDPVYEAAPDLLAACEALLNAFAGYEMLAALDIDVQEQARVAIAKAKGETNDSHD